MFGRGAKLRMRLLWPCKDGYVTFALMGGKLGAKSNEVVARWIVEEGMAPISSRRSTGFPGHGQADQEDQERLEGVVAKFFAKYTKEEIYRRANREGVLLCPSLPARTSWRTPSSSRGRSGRKWNIRNWEPASLIPDLSSRRHGHPCHQEACALIGEHNAEVYKGELGLSEQELGTMRRDGVI